MMSPEQEQEQLDELARVIKQRTEAAFEELMTRLQAGEDPRAATEAVTSQFHGQYYDELSAAFSTVLDRAIGSADIRSLPVSDVALSERLYRHTAEVNAVTRQIIKDHVKGFTQARELAMQIYEGYGFKDDPLKVQVNLPKYLREALQDPAISQGFAQIVGRIRADNLKTPALKAAYLQAIDALEAGAGGNRLKKLMQTAWFERNRYFANRIAQTELHRAYSNQVAQEIMADEATVWVKYQMSKTHPKVDICDRHAGMNGWGKGPGIYPKAQAPKPPAHPFCRCTVRPAYEVEGEPGKPVKDAEQRFMNRLSDYDQRLVAGSRDRLQQFRDGRSLESIYNEGKNPIYRWGRVGDEFPSITKQDGIKIVEDNQKDTPDAVSREWINGKITVKQDGDITGLSTTELARLAGVPDGSVMVVKKKGKKGLLFEARQGLLRVIEGSAYVDQDGSYIYKTEFFVINRDLQPPPGLGVRLLATQVKALQLNGFAKMKLYAAGEYGNAVWNGYYTWPRYGYDANLDASIISKLPDSLRSASTVLDLMETKEGRSWWKVNGRPMNMTFDLSPGSRSLRVLQNYLDEKGYKI